MIGCAKPARIPVHAMSLHILSKKSWHVWNDDNVARVKRDEAQSAVEQGAVKKRAVSAEQEARLDKLRAKAVSQLQDPGRHASVVASISAPIDEAGPVLQPRTNAVRSDVEHINLFAGSGAEFFRGPDQDHGSSAPPSSTVATSRSENMAGGAGRGAREIARKDAVNPEYEAERKAAEERARKRIGIQDWKLGDGAAETARIKPWYHYPPGQAPPSALYHSQQNHQQQQQLQSQQQEQQSRSKQGAPAAQNAASSVSAEIMALELQAAKEREDRRKNSLDPLALIKSRLATVAAAAGTGAVGSAAVTTGPIEPSAALPTALALHTHARSVSATPVSRLLSTPLSLGAASTRKEEGSQAPLGSLHLGPGAASSASSLAGQPDGAGSHVPAAGTVVDGAGEGRNKRGNCRKRSRRSSRSSSSSGSGSSSASSSGSGGGGSKREEKSKRHRRDGEERKHKHRSSSHRHHRSSGRSRSRSGSKDRKHRKRHSSRRRGDDDDDDVGKAVLSRSSGQGPEYLAPQPNSSSTGSGTNGIDIRALRAGRLAREAAEASRAQRLMLSAAEQGAYNSYPTASAASGGDAAASAAAGTHHPTAASTAAYALQRTIGGGSGAGARGGYHQQYNPHMARQR